MATLYDYVYWRGDLTLAQDPWRTADSALLASVCYLDPGPEGSTPEGQSLRGLALSLRERPENALYTQRRSLCILMAGSRRWSDIRLNRFVSDYSEEDGIQFAAVCAKLPDGMTAVCYRGTDATLVGWREDFELSYVSPVPAQVAAVKYLEAIRDPKLIVLGHSKGGNLAAYAAAHAAEDTQERITSVWSFDGPGLDDGTIASEGYRCIAGRLHSLIPQSSVIGLLMDYHPDYTVVRAEGISLIQHNLLTWQMEGPEFGTVPTTTISSQIMDRALHDWLKAATADERRVFVESVFKVLEASGAKTIAELKALDLPAVGRMTKAVSELEPETRRLVTQLLTRFFTLGASSAVSLGREFLSQSTPGSFLAWLQKGGGQDGKDGNDS